MITPVNNRLTIFDSPQPESRLIGQHIKALAELRGALSILEAGCGNSWQIDLQGVTYELTGVDINSDALNARKRLHGDLNHCIQGDLCTVALPEAKYDVIYNSFVLEHVRDAEKVLDNFRRWLSPGGILILRIPDRWSVYGFIARLTPFWAHVLYKRYVAGVKTAGKPGFDPFPTVYEPIVSRTGISRWCATHGLNVQAEVGWNYPIVRPGLLSVLVHSAIRVLGFCSLGRLATDHVNLTYVIETPSDASMPCDSQAGLVSAEVLP